MTFRHRIALASAAAVAVAVILASIVTYLVVKAQLRSEVDRALTDRGDLIASLSLAEAPVPSEGGQTSADSLTRVQLSTDLPPPAVGQVFFVQLVKADGTVVLPRDQHVRIPFTFPVSAIPAGAVATTFRDQTVDGVHYRVSTQQVNDQLVLLLAAPLTGTDDTLRRLAAVLAGVSGGGIALAAGLGLVVTRAGAGPLARLTQAAERVTETGDLRHRIEGPAGPDELGRLATSFNAMLGALETSIAAQRQLVADASHELRTPLTSVRTNLDLLASKRQLPDGERERLLADVQGQFEELSAIVGDLVELARGNEPVPSIEEVRLDRVVDAAVQRSRRLSPAVSFTTRLEPSVVAGDPQRLHRAFANLLDNAAKWSPADQPVEVTVIGGSVTVRDHGPGFDEEELPYVFDRFFRARAARGTPGSGLGLAIVRQVAEAHRGTVTAANAEGGGAVLCMTLLADFQLPFTDDSHAQA